MEQTLTIRGRMVGLNEYIKIERGNRQAANATKQRETARVEQRASRLLPMRGVVDIDFEWHEPNRRRDHDNVRFAAKFILDGLVRAGVLEGDGPRFVGDFTDRFFVDRDDPRVVVTIRERGTK